MEREGDASLGVVVGDAQSFTSRKYFEYVAVHSAGRVPPRGAFLELQVDPSECPEEELASLDLEGMKRKAAELGAVAFSSVSRVFYKALVGTEKWVPSPTSPSDTVLVLQNYHLPWHLVDVRLELPSECTSAPFASLSIQVEFHTDVPQNANWYICLFGGNMNHGHFYGGLQTNVGTPGSQRGGPRVYSALDGSGLLEDASSEPEHARRDPDYGAIFSRWGPATYGDIAVPKEGASFAEAADYEGDFCSVRRHLHWRKGKYRLRLVRDQRVEAQGTWVRFEVEPEGQDAIVVGWLFFRGSDELTLADTEIYNFTELYGEDGSYDLETYCPGFSYSVSDFCLNGAPIVPVQTHAEYWKQTPMLASVSCDETAWKLTTHVAKLSSFPSCRYKIYSL